MNEPGLRQNESIGVCHPENRMPLGAAPRPTQS
jgi:hypothetical protein